MDGTPMAACGQPFRCTVPDRDNRQEDGSSHAQQHQPEALQPDHRPEAVPHKTITTDGGGVDQ
jgi:hypothetical protein